MDLTLFLQKTGSLLPKSSLPYSLVEGGLPRAGLIEISGAAGGGRIEALLRLLAENSELQAAWVEEGDSTYPCAFPQHGVDLERVLFVNATSATELGMCAHQILKSGIFGVVILIPRDSVHSGFIPTTHPSDPRMNPIYSCAGPLAGGLKVGQDAPREIEHRRLQIAAERAQALAFIVRERPSVEGAWPLAAQLQVSRVQGEIRLQVLKRKYSLPELRRA